MSSSLFRELVEQGTRRPKPKASAGRLFGEPFTPGRPGSRPRVRRPMDGRLRIATYLFWGLCAAVILYGAAVRFAPEHTQAAATAAREFRWYESRAEGPGRLRAGEPGYRRALDRDRDGTTCEWSERG